jgi:hypothetical protein
VKAVVEWSAVDDVPRAGIEDENFAGSGDAESLEHELTVVLENGEIRFEESGLLLKRRAIVLGIPVQEQDGYPVAREPATESAESRHALAGHWTAHAIDEEHDRGPVAIARELMECAGVVEQRPVGNDQRVGRGRHL